MDYDAEMATGEVQVEATATPTPAPVAPAPKLRPHWSMNIIGIAGILALCYFGESVLAVMMVSVLLAFILAPVVDLLTWLLLPRSLAAAIAILLLLAALCGIVYTSYNLGKRSHPGGIVHTLSGVFHVDLATACALGNGHAFPLA